MFSGAIVKLEAARGGSMLSDPPGEAPKWELV